MGERVEAKVGEGGNVGLDGEVDANRTEFVEREVENSSTGFKYSGLIEETSG